MNVLTHINSHIHHHPIALKSGGKRVLSFQLWFLAPCLPSPSCLLLFAAIWDKQADLTGPVLPVDAGRFPLSIINPRVFCSIPSQSAVVRWLKKVNQI